MAPASLRKSTALLLIAAVLGFSGLTLSSFVLKRAPAASPAVRIAAAAAVAPLAPVPPAPVARVAAVVPLAPTVPSQPMKPIKPAVLASAISLHEHFRAHGYTLDGIRLAGATVPRVFIARLPRDLPDLVSPDFRKTVFIKMMLPLVLKENERIRADRARALAIRALLEDDLSVKRGDVAWLAALAGRYGVDDGNLDELFRRVDIVPPALALGQAALETGWGTSPVAQRSHAMFGQMEFRINGDSESSVASVRSFGQLSEAIEAYAFNLNTHWAYAEFRDHRAAMRAAGQVLDGYELALDLTRYSERKLDYVRDVRGIIRTNRLHDFDSARLGD